MILASFEIPEKYRMPFQWADVFNQVKIYNGPTLCWSGYIYALERYWGETSGIKVNCVGWVAKFKDILDAVSNLSNAKASAYIISNIFGVDEVNAWIDQGTIDTSDYTIPGVRDYQPVISMREIMDDLYPFNQNTHTWYIWDNDFYFVPIETELTYITNTECSVGSLRQELGEFSNYIIYTYRDADGVIQYGGSEDTDSVYPTKYQEENYSDNMTSAQAAQLASESLSQHEVLGATAEITISKLWTITGQEIHPSEIRPGKLIHIGGLVSAKASPSEVFSDNDIDTFIVKSVTYDHNSQTASISPGRLPYTLPRVIASK